ncbi:MAG: hypothetical protein JXR14_15095 [Paracoccaceae bacterium]
MSKYGPTRGELWFRLGVSLIGLGAMLFAILYRGGGGIAWLEVAVISGAFFGGSAIWSGWKLYITS